MIYFFQYGLGPTLMGLLFLAGPGMYGIAAPLCGKLADSNVFTHTQINKHT